MHITMSARPSLSEILQKHKEERAYKQTHVAPVTQTPDQTPPQEEQFPKLLTALQNARTKREQAKKSTPMGRDAVSEFMQAQQKAQQKAQEKTQGHKKDEDIDWSFTVRSGLVLMVATVTYIITIASVRV